MKTLGELLVWQAGGIAVDGVSSEESDGEKTGGH